MVNGVAKEVSKSAARKAGSTIRAFMRGEVSHDEFFKAIRTVQGYRRLFATPMDVVNANLLSLAPHVDGDAEITSRLKRLPTIIDKLSRLPKTDLSRMYDIGGCRAVMTDLGRLDRLRAQVEDAWGSSLRKEIDYIAKPRESGYRAVHLIVVEDGREVEVQLRTKSMHTWAQSVESFSNVLGENYKQDGDHVVQRYMQAYSDVLWCEEIGSEPPLDTLDMLNALLPEMQELISQVASEKGQA